MQNTVEVLLIQDLVLMLAENSQDQTVEKDPFVLEEFVQKEAHMFTRNHGCKQPKDPLTCIHLSPDIMFNQVALKLWKIYFYKQLDHLTVFEETWQLRKVDISHLTVLYQCNKEPECERLRTMEKQLCHYKVHALDIIHLAIVVRESYQYSS